MEPRAAQAHPLPVALTIAGFDPTSGAGVSADVKTFAAHNCYGVAVVTAINTQDSVQLHARHNIEANLVAEQLRVLAADLPIATVKVGMLGTAAIVEAVAALLEKHTVPFVVVDPALRSTSGAVLLEADGLDVLRRRLLPRATVLTPNMQEAAELTGMRVQTLDDVKKAAGDLYAACRVPVVITGGRLDKPQDVFFNGTEYSYFAGDRIPSEQTHGTGCAFSAAIAANLALGKPVVDAVVLAKAYVTKIIEKGQRPGRGLLLNHLYRLQPAPTGRVGVAEPVDVHAGGHR